MVQIEHSYFSVMVVQSLIGIRQIVIYLDYTPGEQKQFSIHNVLNIQSRLDLPSVCPFAFNTLYYYLKSVFIFFTIECMHYDTVNLQIPLGLTKCLSFL